jgi:hypothetical protein
MEVGLPPISRRPARGGFGAAARRPRAINLAKETAALQRKQPEDAAALLDWCEGWVLPRGTAAV